ncbi:hypothetical protein EVAR_66155_1 [Eumeta japonica]|uniref:Uncharacterized protein n=1 Tax=Eumeta variegata TaxID=151549 RepID=A0A4C2A4L9_EUMVA|nr:hypothetical protein EVAR_66155_1 [Eumeta japonica]
MLCTHLGLSKGFRYGVPADAIEDAGDVGGTWCGFRTGQLSNLQSMAATGQHPFEWFNLHGTRTRVGNARVPLNFRSVPAAKFNELLTVPGRLGLPTRAHHSLRARKTEAPCLTN